MGVTTNKVECTRVNDQEKVSDNTRHKIWYILQTCTPYKNYIYTSAHIHIHMHTHMRAHTHTHTPVLCTHTCTHTHILTHCPTLNKQRLTLKTSLQTYAIQSSFSDRFLVASTQQSYQHPNVAQQLTFYKISNRSCSTEFHHQLHTHVKKNNSCHLECQYAFCNGMPQNRVKLEQILFLKFISLQPNTQHWCLIGTIKIKSVRL